MEDLMGVLGRIAPRLGPVTTGPVPLEGGITNRNYRVSFGQRDCVVRLPGKDTALLGISREAELLAGRTAAALGIGPAVLAAAPEYVVTEYVAGEPMDAGALRASPEPVAAALRAFHDAGAELPVRFWVPELLGSYARIVAERGGALPGQYREAARAAWRIAEVVPLRAPVACHDDLLPANVLRVRTGGSVMLVDWEYAGMGHRLFDLGNLAVNAEFDEPEELALLAAYYGQAASPGRRAALALMRIMSDAREAAWGVVQGVVSELDFDFEGYAALHFERLARAVSSASFEAWLRAAAAEKIHA
jgi:aminoglycoside phosphotransferase (APT) family kinase protein